MAPASRSPGKRKLDSTEKSISPPPLKRKIPSGTTKSAVASFFTPTSKKPKDKTTWSKRAKDDDTPATLLVGRYEPDEPEDGTRAKRRKVAAFDLDSTLITTSSGKTHADAPGDWKWWNASVPRRVRELYAEGYRIAILSNQLGLNLHPDPNSKAPKKALQDRIVQFKQKCNAVLSHLDIPLTVYAATGKDIFRKPRTGMWAELCRDYHLNDDADLQNSFFVGDAGGRPAAFQPVGGKASQAATKDFSCSDRDFAHNIGIEFKTPDEFFLGEQPRKFFREFDLEHFPYVDSEEVLFKKMNKKDIVIFCGPPGAGKSTFYWKNLKPLGYQRVNQDILKSRENCVKAAAKYLEDGESVAVDNTNFDPQVRAVWVDLAKKHNVPIRCVWLKTPLYVSEHNDAVRSMNREMNPESRSVLPRVAFTGFKLRFKEPKVTEGFQDVTEIEFRFRGTKEEYAIWGRYWR